MLKLLVLGSGSDGNSAVLSLENWHIILDCGINSKEVKRCLGYDITGIQAAICSHGHGDHSRYIQDFLDMGIDVYMPYTVKAKYGQNNAVQIEPMKPTKIGFATVTAFKVPHTSFDRKTGQLVPCVNYGYYIEADEQRLLFATDYEFIGYNFKKWNINHFLLECNHCDSFLDRNEMKWAHVVRGHSSLSVVKDIINANKTPAMRNIVLLHLSADWADEEQMVREIKEVAGSEVNVAVGKKGYQCNLSLYPWEE